MVFGFGGDSYDTRRTDQFNPNDFSLSEYGKTGADPATVDRLRNTGFFKTYKNGNEVVDQGYRDSADPNGSGTLDTLVASYLAWVNQYNKTMTDYNAYLQLKGQAPGREATIVVPEVNKGNPTTVLGVRPTTYPGG